MVFLKRAEESLFSILLGLRRVPNITYSLESRIGQKLAERLSSRVEREYTQNHKEFLQEGLEMIIFDRREDPITPLIYNWSYQAMVHEFLGIDNNSIKTNDGKSEIFARQTEDNFIDENWDKNYGEFTLNLSQALEKINKLNPKADSLKTIEDMQAALEKMPELSKEAQRVRKHSAVIQQIASIVHSTDIYTVSQLQQDIICENKKSEQFKELLSILAKRNVTNMDKLKLSLLYALKYHDDGERLSGLTRALNAQSLPSVILPNFRLSYQVSSSTRGLTRGRMLSSSQLLTFLKKYLSTTSTTFLGSSRKKTETSTRGTDRKWSNM